MKTRMDKAIKGTAKYWIEKFSGRLLPKDDLEQEAYLVFLRCQDYYDSSKDGKLNTYYSRFLRNHFIDLHRSAKKRETIEILIMDDPEQIDWVNKIIEEKSGGAWNTEEIIEWNELIANVSNALDDRLRGIFFLLLEPTKTLMDLTIRDSGNITNTSLIRYFSVSRDTINRQMEELKEIVLSLLE